MFRAVESWLWKPAVTLLLSHNRLSCFPKYARRSHDNSKDGVKRQPRDGAVAGPTTGQEVKIKRSELPPAVAASVVAQSARSTIKGFSRDKENGETIYEVEMITAGRTKDVSMNAKGEVLEIEEEVSMDHLPAAVKTGLQRKASAGKITKVESLTKKGKIVAYEAQVNTAGKRSELQVGPDGAAITGGGRLLLAMLGASSTFAVRTFSATQIRCTLWGRRKAE